MRVKVDDNNFFYEFSKHKKFILMVFRKPIEGVSLELRLETEQQPNTKYVEFTKMFEDVVFMETIIDEQYNLIEYLNINDKNIYDFDGKFFNPRMIVFENGWKKFDQSGKMCYCLETLIKLVFDLHPELIPKPSSEG